MTKSKIQTRRLFVLLALSAVGLCLAKRVEIACAPAASYENYAIEFDYYGMDAQKIESLIAVPLERKIGALENFISISTTCEYSKCQATATFNKSEKGAFFDICAAAGDLHKTLPKDAQRPRIYAASSESKWLFCAAFDAQKYSREEIERKLKGPWQSIPGSGKAVFSGGDAEEIQLVYDGALLCKMNKVPWDLAELSAQKNAAAFFGTNMAYEQRLESVHEMNADRELSALSKAQKALKKKDSIVRVNGSECVLASLQCSSESKSVRTAAQARAVLKKQFPQKGEFQIVLDVGKEQERLLLSLSLAFLQSMAALAAAVFFFYRSARKVLAVLLLTATGLLFTLAAMGALKIPLDGNAISGITISLGLMSDAALYLSDDCKSSRWAMAASCLTTICAILPLCALDKIAAGIKELSLVCALAVGMSGVLAAAFCPLFFGNKDGGTRANAEQRAQSFLNLFTFRYKISKTILNLSYFLYIFPLVLFIFLPKNLASPQTSRSIHAQIEYPPERRAEAIDYEVLKFSLEAKKIKGVEFVQSESRRGSAEIQIVAKSARQRVEVLKQLEGLASTLTGSLCLPLSAQKKVVQSVRVSVLGDDFSACKKLSKEAAALALKNEWFIKNGARAIFNFKDDERVFVASPKAGPLARAGLSVQELCKLFRWNIFGAVIHKARSEEGPVDVRAVNKRLAFLDKKSLEDLNLICAPVAQKSVPLSALCSIQIQKRPSKIYRKDSKRAAHWTLEIESDKSDKVFSELKKALKEMNLPQGYWFEFPREWENMKSDYAAVFSAFLLALLAIYVLIAAQCERPLDALKGLATVPLSLCVPLALRAATFTPLKLGDAAGMAFVSGLCVNNALYIMAEYNLRGRKDARAAVQSVLKSVLASSATTIVSSIPPLILSPQGFAGDLAFFTLFGTLGSLPAALFVFPILLENANVFPTKTRADKKNAPTKNRGASKKLRLKISFRSRRFLELSSSTKFPRQWREPRRQERT